MARYITCPTTGKIPRKARKYTGKKKPIVNSRAGRGGACGAMIT
jgi:hypothetical protein